MTTASAPPAADASTGRSPSTRLPWWRGSARRWQWSGYLYLVPALTFYGAFTLLPIADTAWTSFYSWDGLTPAEWVGLDNYAAALTDPRIHTALAHSLSYIFFYALFPTALALMLAGSMTRIRIRGMTAFRSILFVPQVLSSVVVAVAWRWIYDVAGPLNAGLGAVGLGGLTRPWLGDFDTALPAVGLIGTWVQVGLILMLFLAGTQRISPALYEAARVDGAGAVREFFAVTVPGLRSEIRIALVLSTIFALRNFDIVWNTTAGGPGSSTTVPSVYVYQGAFLTRDVGWAASVAVLLTLLIFALAGTILGSLRDRD
jgi:raffinose/stachyose/melibiose transport system permease protein